MKLMYLKLLLCIPFLLVVNLALAKADGSRQKEHLQFIQVCDEAKVCLKTLVFDAHVYGPNISEFLEKVKNLPEGTTILMSGYGRDLSSGIILGEIIRQKKFNVWVGRVTKSSGNNDVANKAKGVCLSACAMAVLGGVKRRLDYDDQFGVTSLEAIRSNLPDEKYQQALLDTRNYISRMGIDDTFFVFLRDLDGRKIKLLDLRSTVSFGIKN